MTPTCSSQHDCTGCSLQSHQACGLVFTHPLLQPGERDHLLIFKLSAVTGHWLTSGVTPAHLAALLTLVVVPGIRLGWHLAPGGINVIPACGEPIPASCPLLTLLGALRLQPVGFSSFSRLRWGHHPLGKLLMEDLAPLGHIGTPNPNVFHLLSQKRDLGQAQEGEAAPHRSTSHSLEEYLCHKRHQTLVTTAVFVPKRALSVTFLLAEVEARPDCKAGGTCQPSLVL